MTSPARAAADIAAALPLDDPLGQLARRRLAQAAREQERAMRKLTDDSPTGSAQIADPRAVQPIQIGSKLRDAAVDPHPGDFLAPTRADESDPHGPRVVSGGVA